MGSLVKLPPPSEKPTIHSKKSWDGRSLWLGRKRRSSDGKRKFLVVLRIVSEDPGICDTSDADRRSAHEQPGCLSVISVLFFANH